MSIDSERLPRFEEIEQRGELAGLVDGGAAAAGDVTADRLDLEHCRRPWSARNIVANGPTPRGQIQHADAFEWP